MKKLLLTISLFYFCIVSNTYAGGGITHMFLAEETIALLPDAKLRGILLTHLDAYRVGAYYPDSGFVGDNQYGEDSHWDPFINAFMTHLKIRYANPSSDNPKLVAFFFGCAVHRLSDEIMHWTFYNVSKDQDFAGDWNLAHEYGDLGIDLLINIDQNQWLTHPKEWWVPVADLVAIYRLMGKEQYTAAQIIRGNIGLYFAGYGERLISLPAYPYLQQRMPWTATHYMNWPSGGILADEQQVAQYLDQLWRVLQEPTSTIYPAAHKQMLSETNTRALLFAQKILSTGSAQLEVVPQMDGSVILKHPVITNQAAFHHALNQLLT